MTAKAGQFYRMLHAGTAVMVYSVDLNPKRYSAFIVSLYTGTNYLVKLEAFDNPEKYELIPWAELKTREQKLAVALKMEFEKDPRIKLGRTKAGRENEH